MRNAWPLVLTVCLACSEDVTPAGPTLEVFAPGVVSSELPEFATTFSPSGDTVFYNRTSADRSRLDLFYSTRVDGSWSPGRAFEPLEGVRAIDPFLTADGGRLYFSSDLPPDGRPGGSFNLWFLERTPTGWSEPRFVPTVGSDSSDVFNSLAEDGTMVFSSRRDGVRRIYAVRPEADGWSEPELVRFGDVDEGSNPAISPDGRFVVFSRPTPAGPPDLFVSCRSESGWDEPQRLPEPVSSPFTELAPGFAGPDLYFTSERPGVVPAVPDSVRPPGDIYRTPKAWIAAMCPSATAELRHLHRELIRAHLEGDVDLWMSLEADGFVSVNRGRVAYPNAADRRAQRTAYLQDASFTAYRDLREPTVRVSEDGSLGWLIAEVEIEGTAAGPDGTREAFHDVWAWVELYEHTNEGWQLVGNASNRRDP
jgi:hypothetical protein